MNKSGYTIRLERPDDYLAVETMTRDAFWNLSVPGCDEHYLVHVMRDHEDFVSDLDLVMEVDGKIVGNVMYTRTRLVDEKGTEKPVLSFGPLCIHPDYQRKGYGKALLAYSFSKASGLGYDTVVIFGNPAIMLLVVSKAVRSTTYASEVTFTQRRCLLKSLKLVCLTAESGSFMEVL